jgi:hypothetical protein
MYATKRSSSSSKKGGGGNSAARAAAERKAFYESTKRFWCDELQQLGKGESVKYFGSSTAAAAAIRGEDCFSHNKSVVVAAAKRRLSSLLVRACGRACAGPPTQQLQHQHSIFEKQSKQQAHRALSLTTPPHNN